MPASSKIELPPLPAKSPGKPTGKRYKRQFGVIVLAEDEPAQKALFEDLKAQGHKCRVVNT
ncbi:hypothetical protein PXK01_16730 [Phaeobacter sp. PT47_59]|uniref:hypothetical protein n=1 Tax=Phaeobacter sp. PT47_59 TaxID=3029979 RepID=UPI0023806ADA|nr:hypothetical protein [Phaeobacter sp. PT47_59]MDE4175810.1 hypothetical protein [Phaeobacter sp. PT47_59]